MDAGAPLGTTCGLETQCQSGRCVDGRCCDQTCDAACDFCDLAGSEGQCTLAPFGRPPVPSCAGGFSCNGASTACVSTCNSDAGCVNARCGAGGVCIPKLETHKDDFNSGGLDASTWSNITANTTVVAQQFRTVTQIASNDYFMLMSRNRYDLLGSEFRVQLVDPGDQTLGSMEAIAGVCDFPGNSRCLSIVVGDSEVVLQRADRVANTYQGIIGPFPLTNLRSYRVREQAGTLYLEVQNDAGTYVQLGSTATPFITQMNDATMQLGAGTFANEANTSTVIWDNVNSP